MSILNLALQDTYNKLFQIYHPPQPPFIEIAITGEIKTSFKQLKPAIITESPIHT